jgi:two-component system NarL family response regulator
VMTTTSPRPIRVMIADDHILMREGIAAVLAAFDSIEVVGQAGNGQEAVEQFLRLRPDVTLLDLQMPLLGGFDAMVSIRSLDRNARIIVLTSYKGDAQVGRALKAGAAGYLFKGALRMDLAAAIQTVHAGERHIPPELAAEIAAYFECDALSGRELEVLRLVAQGNTNKEVGRQLAIKEETVKAHVSAALAKLGANDRTHAVTIAVQRGFLDV